LKVYLTPGLDQISDSNGIGRVVAAQYKYLPHFGVEFVAREEDAEIVAVHAATAQARQVDVLFCHGLYFEDVPHDAYAGWHYKANANISKAARQARAVVVPSSWVALPFRRDMRINPWVIPHGIELADWKPQHTSQGYALWNKGRADDVCDPTPALALAKRGLRVVSTFAPKKAVIPTNLELTGPLPAKEMKRMIQEADVYLATTLETFGIGTLEALASGVPVLGFDWGGTADIVEHKISGYLAKPGDFDELEAGYHWLMRNRSQVSAAARQRAEQFTWPAAIQQYARMLAAVYAIKEASGVAVVVPCYNYGQWVGEAIQSVLDQSDKVQEIIVVDDGSTDNSRTEIEKYQATGTVKAIYQDNQGVATARNNGIAATQQPFVICLDADDKLHPEYVRICRREIQKDRALGIVYTGLQIITPEGQIGPMTDWPPQFNFSIQMKVTNPPANCIPSAAMFRRVMWQREGGFKQRYAPGEDTEFWTRGIAHGFEAKRATDERLFLYRGHAGSASRTKPYMPIDDDKPWMHDLIFPLGAPSTGTKKALSYADPLISVIIPVGPGHTSYAIDALESLMAQSFRQWEAVVVDDTLHHEGENTVSEFKPGSLERFAFIVYTVNLKGHGAGRARNIGLAAARAPLVLFLDADDYLQPEALEKMLRLYIILNGERYIYTDWWLDTGKLERFKSGEFDQASFKMQHPVTVLMARATALEIGGFDETLPVYEDHDFFLKMQIHGHCGSRLPQPVLTYRSKLGQRRIKGEQEINSLLRKRYEAYFDGGEKMSPCCGDSGAAGIILQAKGKLGMTNQPPASQSQTVYPATVRLEYVGVNAGAISFTVNGRSYRGGRNPTVRFIDAQPADVEFLLITGRWQRVERPGEAAQPAAASAPEAESAKTAAVQPPEAPPEAVIKPKDKIKPPVPPTEAYHPDQAEPELEIPSTPSAVSANRRRGKR